MFSFSRTNYLKLNKQNESNTSELKILNCGIKPTIKNIKKVMKMINIKWHQKLVTNMYFLILRDIELNYRAKPICI